MNRITRGLPAARRWRSVLAAAALVTGAGFAAAISPAAAAAATGSPSICPDANVSAFGPNVSVNQCSGGSCTALVNFWRSVSNLTINVTGGTGCHANAEFWAVSQASPLRRVHINGNVTLFD